HLWFKFETGLSSGVSLGREYQSGNSVEQSVGFVLNDDDVGDYYSCMVYKDPTYGTPIFFTEGGVSSDPWEKGTYKGVDVTLQLLEEPNNAIPFDYQDGAHYKVRVTYTGEKELEAQGMPFSIYSSPNDDQVTARFNGDSGPYGIELSKESPSVDIVVSFYPPAKDQSNSEEKTYTLGINVGSDDDSQIGREMTVTTKFADLRAPRAIITAPYLGERISPVFFPTDDPFDILVVSEDTDIESIQLQIRSKQPDGVWEPWRNLSGMAWKAGTTSTNVSVFERLDRRPVRREFAFKWTDSEIAKLGVGEYALQAIATDKATRPNTDIDPPNVVFLVDDSKPSVLTSIPDYQERESNRIYRGELSVL
ncbi:MAG: hypothetical protein AAB296_00560, partial [Candidatus Desantisbacteria bacterium]